MREVASLHYEDTKEAALTDHAHTTLIGLALVGCVFALGCNTSDQYGGSPSPVAPSPAGSSNTFAIDIAEINGPFSFIPSPASIRSDQVAIWHNTDSVTHHVVLDDGSVDTGTLAPGTMSQPIAMAPGTHSYHCTIHPEMVGTVSVSASAGDFHGTK
jgi:plastocyanin